MDKILGRNFSKKHCKECNEDLQDNEIFDILGIEEENRDKEEYKKMLGQFRDLAKEHDKNDIWLKGDKDIAAKGDVVAETDDLIVCKECKNESLKEDKECFFEIVFKEKDDEEEKTERYEDDFDGARADFLHMTQDDRDNYQYVVLRKVCTDYNSEEDIEVIDSFGLDESLKEDAKDVDVEAEVEVEEPKKDAKEPKLETFDEQMDFLAKDEQEAIDGYDKVLALVEDEHVKEQLEHIKEEEIAHKEFLEAVKSDKSLVYSHEDKEEKDEPKDDDIEIDADMEVIDDVDLDDFDDEFGVGESLEEDTVKKGDKWVNKGDEGTHGEFKTKKEADAQRKAMFANGYHEEVEEDFDDDFGNVHCDGDDCDLGVKVNLDDMDDESMNEKVDKLNYSVYNCSSEVDTMREDNNKKLTTVTIKNAYYKKYPDDSLMGKYYNDEWYVNLFTDIHCDYPGKVFQKIKSEHPEVDVIKTTGSSGTLHYCNKALVDLINKNADIRDVFVKKTVDNLNFYVRDDKYKTTYDSWNNKVKASTEKVLNKYPKIEEVIDELKKDDESMNEEHVKTGHIKLKKPVELKARDNR